MMPEHPIMQRRNALRLVSALVAALVGCAPMDADEGGMGDAADTAADAAMNVSDAAVHGPDGDDASHILPPDASTGQPGDDTGSDGPTDQQTDDVVASTLKAPCHGVMSRSGLPPANMPFIDNAVVNIGWRQLETADQQFNGPGWGEIETALSRGLAVRLRVMAGIHAPDFVKRLGGTPVSDMARGVDCSRSGGIAVFNPFDQTGGCSTFFWRDSVIAQYEQLMREIARRYDQHPQVREVVDSGCMTVYAEPFYRAHRDADSNRRFWEAGLNATSDRACHERAIQIHRAAFARTRTSLAVNPWDIIDGTRTGYFYTSWRHTYDFANWARAQMGARLVLQNNGLGENDRCPATGSPMTNHFCYLASVERPKGFQSETLPRLAEGASSGEEGFYMAAQNALSMGAIFIEMPGGYNTFEVNRLRDLDTRLQTR